MACVYIPVQNSEEEVRVSLDHLPRDATDILDILNAEQAPLNLWLIIAREYFKQGKVTQFLQILEEGSGAEIDEYYSDVKYERITILNALGAYYSYLGKIENNVKDKDQHFIQATQIYNKASKIEVDEPSTWVGKGQLLLAKGDVDQAFNLFKIALDGYPDNIPALLGQASVQFNRGRYSESLELYKRALRVYPECPGAVRLGRGLCRYKLGHFEKARQAFQRVLQLDPDNVEALVALGVMELHGNDAGGIKRGMERMKLAFEVYPYNPLSLNYLADHFFFTGQHFLVEQLTETALAVTNHGPTKAHSYYNLARSYHIKYPEYVDSLLRLAAIAKARNNIRLSIELVGEALKVNDKCPNSLTILGCLELKNDEWVKAKDTFRAASEAADGKDFYASVCLGNWNYFAALVSELKKQVKHIPVHLEKAKDIFSNVLKKCPSNFYAANGLGLILAEKGQFDVSKEILTQVQEAVSGTVFAQMPDAWINLAHIYFAQYQNCMRKFFHNTDSQVLLYLARTFYEAEQWQDSKRALLKAIHLSPSNYTLRFNLGAVMQKFSASLLNKEKRSADEMRTTVSELEIAISVFEKLAAGFNQNIHGIDEKKIDTHVGYCKHLLGVAKVYKEAAELEEQQSRQKQELARQVSLAEEASRKAEEQKKLQMERRKQEEELKRAREMEARFERVKEQLKSSSQPSKRKDRDDEGEHTEKKRRKGGKKRRDKSGKSHYEIEEVDDGIVYQEDMDEPQSDYGEHANHRNTSYDNEEDKAENLIAAAGLEDSDAEDNMDAPTTAIRRRQAWAESDEDEPTYNPEDSSLLDQQNNMRIARDDQNEPNGDPEEDVD